MKTFIILLIIGLISPLSILASEGGDFLKGFGKVAAEIGAEAFDESLAKTLDSSSISKMDKSYAQMMLRIKDKAERQTFSSNYNKCKLLLTTKAKIKKQNVNSYILSQMGGKDIKGINALTKTLIEPTTTQPLKINLLDF